jgi:hypothetical protein
MRKRTILMYARSRGGKTSLLAELAEDVQVKLGKKSLVYSIDKGGTGPLTPYVDLGVVDLVEQQDLDPWVFLNNAVSGKVRDAKGKWIPADLSQYGMVGFESMTGWADALMESLAEKASNNINIGGGVNVSFQVSGDGDTVKIGGANQSHYGIVQGRVLKEIWKSQKLAVPYIVWTAAASKEDDQNAGGKVIGPAVVGKALTAEIPRHFDLTFRLDCLPSSQGKPERHILYLGNSIDMAAGNAVSLGNTRVPLGAPELPASIEPASLVKALALIEDAENKAKEAIKARLSAKK